jgi:hypothetical protein
LVIHKEKPHRARFEPTSLQNRDILGIYKRYKKLVALNLLNMTFIRSTDLLKLRTVFLNVELVDSMTSYGAGL